MSRPQWETPEISILREARQAQTGPIYLDNEGTANFAPGSGPSGGI